MQINEEFYFMVLMRDGGSLGGRFGGRSGEKWIESI